jgi:preprotein translocase subunit SecA
MIGYVLKKIIGSKNDRELKRLSVILDEINGLEESIKRLTDAQIQAKTGFFKERLGQGAELDDILPEAFAVAREAARRTLGMRPFDVQVIGGLVLHEGKIAEMKTGEGKTLAATMPVYLNALKGRGVHVVTVNDYLAKRDAQWMGPIYRFLGLSVGVIVNGIDDDERRAAYNADVTYGTNNEFGFDYLRDNLVMNIKERVQRGHAYAIIDEVDNILIDEARTPLIISGPAEESSDLYRRFAEIVRSLKPSSPDSVEAEEPDGDYVLDEKTLVVTLTERGVEHVERMMPEITGEASLYDSQHAHMLPYLDNALRAYVTYKRDKDYIVSDDGEVIIVDQFTGRLMHGRRFSEGLHQAIEAKEGVVVQRESLTYATITFQNYFRMYEKLAGMTGTAKTEEEEFQRIYDLDVIVLPTNVEYRAAHGDLVTREHLANDLTDVTFAGVLNGHADAPGNFSGPVMVTTYEPADGGNGRRYFQRLDLTDVIYSTETSKFKAVVEEIKQLHEAGRPVLVGTIAIETSERLSGMLKRRGIPHQVLNAKYHEQEAVIIAQAGRSGAVTIATNMAGRGVDIKLGGDPEGVARDRLRRHQEVNLAAIPQSDWNHALELLRRGQDVVSIYPEPWAEVLAAAVADCAADQKRVVALGGLHILGTERHEARRIDNQLRGRSGRQGDPGSSRFYISLEDELMRRFGGERVQGLMGRFSAEGDIPLQHTWLDKAIESAQMRVEGYNFDIRKHVLEYDDVVNKQREVIYAQRRQVLSAPDLRDQVLRMVMEEISHLIVNHTPGPDPEDWDLRGLYNELRTFFPLPPDFNYRRWTDLMPDQIEAELEELAERAYDQVNQTIGHEVYRQLSREDVTLAVLRRSADPAQRLVHQKAVERWGNPPDAEMEALALRRLPDDVKADIEAAFLDAYRLVRDRQLILRAVDGLWVRHLTDLEILREGIGLRAYGQQNPLVAYRKETHEMYEALLARVQETVARSVYLVPRELIAFQAPRRPQLQMSRPGAPRPTQPTSGPAPSSTRVESELGRNDPCWCGSGKKYKHCHLRQDTEAQRTQTTTVRPPQQPGQRRRKRR